MANILIVDDSSMMRKKLYKILTDGGHNVVGEAADGSKAILEYKKLQPDLVTMDISMPVMNGLEAVKEIISQDKEARIIIITSLAHSEDVLNAITTGAKNYIVKPFEERKVLQVVSDTLKHF